VFGLATREWLLPVEVADLLVGIVAISMVLMPLLAWLSVKFEEHMDDHETAPAEEPESTINDMRNHVIIAGFGRVGQSIAKILAAADIPYVAVEVEPTGVSEALPVFLGNASQLDVQRALGAERARAAVVIMDNADTASRTVALMHHRFPTLDIFVRARQQSQMGARGSQCARYRA